MDDLDYVLQVITPWIDQYISQGPDALSERKLVGVGVWTLDAEVNNGGFLQYYFNSRGRLAKQTVKALRSIGARDTAGALEAANAEIPCWPLPENREERIEILEQVAERARFATLETEYYQQNEDRIHLLAQYLRSTSDA